MRLITILVAMLILATIRPSQVSADQITLEEHQTLLEEKLLFFDMLDGEVLFEIWKSSITNYNLEVMLDQPTSLLVHYTKSKAIAIAAAAIISKRDDAGVAGYAERNGFIQLLPCLAEENRVELRSICAAAIPRLTYAVEAENSLHAMRTLGWAYSEGIGVEKSNLVAADWFYLAAKRHHELEQRIEAISMIEKSLTLFPENERAKKFRDSLFAE